jgi:hypothetical protein
MVAGSAAFGALRFAVRPDFCGYPPGSRRPINCFNHYPCLENGTLQLKISPGQNIYAIVNAHHGSRSDVITLDGGEPFDEIQRANGLDRFFNLRVPRGEERRIAEEYRFDPRIEYADLMGDCPVQGL